MKTNKFVALTLVFALTMALLAGCGGAGGGGAVTLTDMAGREVKLDGPAEKVVALSAGECEIVCALGGLDTLVGRGAYCDWPSEVLDVEAVDSGNETNIEQIIALAPDVVLMSTMAQSTEQVDQLEAAGIPVVTFTETDIEGVYQSIGIIGQVLGKAGEADSLVAEMKQDFEDIAAAVPALDEPKSVYFEVSPLEWGLWTSGANTYMDEIAQLLQMENIFADVEGWAEVSQEQVIERDPDVIVTITMYYGEGPLPEEEIMGREGWEDIAAVQNGDVLNAAQDQLARPGPRLVEGARQLLEFAYPDAA